MVPTIRTVRETFAECERLADRYSTEPRARESFLVGALKAKYQELHREYLRLLSKNEQLEAHYIPF